MASPSGGGLTPKAFGAGESAKQANANVTMVVWIMFIIVFMCFVLSLGFLGDLPGSGLQKSPDRLEKS
jgi:hypothetical protein